MREALDAKGNELLPGATVRFLDRDGEPAPDLPDLGEVIGVGEHRVGVKWRDADETEDWYLIDNGFCDDLLATSLPSTRRPRNG